MSYIFEEQKLRTLSRHITALCIGFGPFGLLSENTTFCMHFDWESNLIRIYPETKPKELIFVKWGLLCKFIDVVEIYYTATPQPMVVADGKYENQPVVIQILLDPLKEQNDCTALLC